MDQIESCSMTALPVTDGLGARRGGGKAARPLETGVLAPVELSRRALPMTIATAHVALRDLGHDGAECARTREPAHYAALR